MRAVEVRACLAALSVAATASLAACSFDASGVGGADAGTAPPDGSPLGDADPVDGGGCEADIVAAISADGTREAATGEPLTRVLVGDTVELSAAGSCVREGPASYAWSISPVDATGDTMLPDAQSETVTLYAARPERYVVTLTITDANDQERSLSRYAIESMGWERLGESDEHPLEAEEIRGVAVGADRLWIAGKPGGFSAPLSDLTATEEVGGAFGEDPVEGELRSAVFGGGSAWLAAQGNHDELLRVDAGESALSEIEFESAYEIRGLAPSGEGVAAASKQGALHIEPDSGVTVLDGDLDLHAVAASGGAIWYGGDRLYRDGAFDEPVDPLDGDAGNDDKIRGLAFGPAGELWIATNERGVVRADATTGENQVVYRAGETALPSDEVRAIAVERGGRFAGDVWVATAAGAARFKRDRGVWVAMGANHGLHLRRDMKAIAVAPPGEDRGIYAGTKDGVVYLRAP